MSGLYEDIVGEIVEEFDGPFTARDVIEKLPGRKTKLGEPMKMVPTVFQASCILRRMRGVEVVGKESPMRFRRRK
jgi:hypothetical protein